MAVDLYNFLQIIEATGDAWPDEIQRAVLLHCLSTKGQWIFYTLPITGTTYKDAEEALKAYFVPKANMVAGNRCQAPHETRMCLSHEYVRGFF